jgi:hypothetical protein
VEAKAWDWLRSPRWSDHGRSSGNRGAERGGFLCKSGLLSALSLGRHRLFVRLRARCRRGESAARLRTDTAAAGGLCRAVRACRIDRLSRGRGPASAAARRPLSCGPCCPVPCHQIRSISPALGRRRPLNGLSGSAQPDVPSDELVGSAQVGAAAQSMRPIRFLWRIEASGRSQRCENVSMMPSAAGPRSTMNRHGKIKRIIGTVSSAGKRAAFSSARVIRACRISAARTRRD